MLSSLSAILKRSSYLLLTGNIIVIVLFVQVQSINKLSSGDLCFCKLEGKIGDCSCRFDTVDYFNNAKIYPRLKSLLTKDYFRFYKVNLRKDCPYWSDDSRCAMRFCHVKPCLEEEIPPGLKGYSPNMHESEAMSHKYLETSQKLDDCESDSSGIELGYLNTTISERAREDFVRWQVFDDTVDNFCTLPDEDGDAQYVDLLLNPERYTGYRGPSAHRIWTSIYKENCFKPKKAFDGLIASHHLNAMCLEKRVFYKVISGLHASINIHLSAHYLLQEKALLGKPGGEWGPNLEEFILRFSPENTEGEGPERLKNLYFLYLLELRAVAKAAPYLQSELFYTGNKQEDIDTRAAIRDLLNVTKSFPEHFNESSMFSGGAQAAKLKEEFRDHFRNISTIMDCVGCDKCRLWGKLQIQGLGTALKILFSGKFDKMDPKLSSFGGRRNFHLQRSEIIALFNALGRLSSSIYFIESFREMMR